MSSDELLTHECDVLIPCALGGVLNRFELYLALKLVVTSWNFVRVERVEKSISATVLNLFGQMLQQIKTSPFL